MCGPDHSHQECIPQSMGLGVEFMSPITHFCPLITHSEEKDVGFEDHVLLDHLLEVFPPKGEVCEVGVALYPGLSP